MEPDLLKRADSSLLTVKKLNSLAHQTTPSTTGFRRDCTPSKLRETPSHDSFNTPRSRQTANHLSHDKAVNKPQGPARVRPRQVHKALLSKACIFHLAKPCPPKPEPPVRSPNASPRSQLPQKRPPLSIPPPSSQTTAS